MSESVLLPTNVRPLLYDIDITPSLVSFTFNGVERIEIDIVQRTRTITLHAALLDISNVSVEFDGNQQLQGRVALNERDQRAELMFDHELPIGKAVLSLAFAGRLTDSLAGFYRSSYKLVCQTLTHYLAIAHRLTSDHHHDCT
jgi:aminopeptidase 2